MKKIISTLIELLLITVLIGCASDAQQPPQPETSLPAEASATEEIESITVSFDGAAQEPEHETPAPTQAPTNTPEPTDTPAPTDTPEPTPEPTETPVPTREPQPRDVATDRFPTYDTGVDADYSYQSDELRIAIKKTVDAENQQTHFIADIWCRSLNDFRAGFARGAFNTGSEDGDKFAKREHAILAVNGSYNKGLLLHNGEYTRGLRTYTYSNWRTWGVGLVYNDGTFKAFDLRDRNFNLKDELAKGVWQGWQFGPALLQGGQIVRDLDARARDPRAVIGYYEPGHYVIVTCDGGRTDAQGMHQQEMAEMLQGMGVQEAMNLDGGTSAVLVFMGEIINQPEARWSNGVRYYGRPVVDMLLFAEYDEEGNAPELSTLTADKFLGK